MSTRIVQVSQIRCDAFMTPPCSATVEASGTIYDARREAQREGWQVRPWRGRGSRSWGDYCPDHKTSAPGGAK